MSDIAKEIACGIRGLMGGPMASQDAVVKFVSDELREVRLAARSAALEEAAKVAEQFVSFAPMACEDRRSIAADIRALKA